MAIEGPLRELGIHDVFQLLDLSRKTGTLTVTSDLRDNQGIVYFDRGAVIFASIKSNPHRLGELLLRAGKITEGDLTRLREQQRREGNVRKLGEILVEAGALTRKELERQVRFQVEEVVFEMMSWREGHFSFEEGKVLDLPTEADIRISTESLLMEAARRIDEWSMIVGKVPNLGVVPVLASGDSEHAGLLDLLPKEWEVLAQIDGARDLKSIASASAMSEFDVARVMYGLVTTGIVELRPSAGAASATSGAASPAAGVTASGAPAPAAVLAPAAAPAPGAALAPVAAPVPGAAPAPVAAPVPPSAPSAQAPRTSTAPRGIAPVPASAPASGIVPSDDRPTAPMDRPTAPIERPPTATARPTAPTDRATEMVELPGSLLHVPSLENTGLHRASPVVPAPPVVPAAVHQEEIDPTVDLVPEPLRAPPRRSPPRGAPLPADDAFVHLEVARSALRRGEAAAAVQAANAAVEASGGSVEARIVLGRALFKAGRVDDALATVRQALQRDALNPALYLLLGACAAARGALPDAVAGWERYVRLAPDAADVSRVRKVAEAAARLRDALQELGDV